MLIWTGSSSSLLNPLPSPHDLLGTSPNIGGSYLSASFAVNALRLSRYRTDFEEVEFLVCRAIREARADLFRGRADSAKSSRLETG